MTVTRHTQKNICSNSVMWQSDRWLSAVDTVYRFKPSRGFVNNPLLLAFRLFLRRRRYRLVLTVGSAVTFVYGLLCRLCFVDPKQVVMELFLDEREDSLSWSVKHKLKKLVMRRVAGVIVTSREEVRLIAERYGIRQDKIRFVPWHTNILNPEVVDQDGGYIFSAGRSLRDYQTLVESCRGMDTNVVIVCGNADIKDTDLPANVSIKREIKRENYLALLKSASFVVVPLVASNRSTGQVAILEAMSFGKAVITADCLGTQDYITDGVDGQYYKLSDVESLRSCIQKLLSDAELRHRLGTSACQSVIEKFSIDAHVDGKIRTINEFLEYAK